MLEMQYGRLAAYLDPNFCAEFPLEEKFESRVWELKIGSALLLSGHPPLEAVRKSGRGGPDFTLRCDSRSVHVEAIRPIRRRLAGQWNEMFRFDEKGFGDFREFTDDDLEVQVIRLTSAIETKRQRRLTHVRAGVVRPDDAFVIAIGDHGTKLLYDPHKPPIFDALFGLGREVLDIDSQTGTLIGRRHTRQDTRRSRSGAAVNSFLFGGAEPAVEVSAIIYSDENLFSRTQESFDELVLVHNPTAKTPVSEGFLRVGSEWARRGDNIEPIARHRWSGGDDGADDA